MIIFPAIDIQKGQVVRLLQGKFDQVTTYAADPAAMARQWADRGAGWLHVIDLDGAKEGRVRNWDSLREITQTVNTPVQMGGGVRALDDIERLMEMGVRRVVLGTKAIEDRGFLKQVLRRWPDRLAVSLDCINGRVAQRGWTSLTDWKGPDLARELEDLGLRYLIYTDIQRDGMLSGPNLDGLKEMLAATGMRLIASGGVSRLEDIRALKALEPQGLIGVITGKALYEGTLNLEEALKICSPNG